MFSSWKKWLRPPHSDSAPVSSQCPEPVAGGEDERGPALAGPLKDEPPATGSGRRSFPRRTPEERADLLALYAKSPPPSSAREAPQRRRPAPARPRAAAWPHSQHSNSNTHPSPSSHHRKLVRSSSRHAPSIQDRERVHRVQPRTTWGRALAAPFRSSRWLGWARGGSAPPKYEESPIAARASPPR